ncbi:MAG TPA: hypothetical protein VH331_09480 [Allosphingosinicella sp.]|jgi:hypothetical protein|nr:hypothetical protein [Allosphingosinicella sp.]
MTKSATDVMQEIIFSAVLDSIAALKTASKGLPNNLVRDMGAIHANVTFADLPAEVQASIMASVRAAFTRLLKEGYSVAPGQGAPPRSPPPRRDSSGEGQRRGGPSGRGPRPGGGRPSGPGRGPGRGAGRGPKPPRS